MRSSCSWDRLKRDVPIYVHLNGSLNKLMMGAGGVFGTEANIIPKTPKAVSGGVPAPEDGRARGAQYADRAAA
jgi:hypothetical protein